MSDRLYAYIPIKDKKESLDAIAERIRKSYPEAHVRIEENNETEIWIQSKYYPLYIVPFWMDRSYWQIFVWRRWGYVFCNDDNECFENRKFLKNICKVLGSEECWYQGEILSEYVNAFNEWDDKDIDMSTILLGCIEYEECKGLSSWDYNNRPFVHDRFLDL